MSLLHLLESHNEDNIFFLELCVKKMRSTPSLIFDGMDWHQEVCFWHHLLGPILQNCFQNLIFISFKYFLLTPLAFNMPMLQNCFKFFPLSLLNLSFVLPSTLSARNVTGKEWAGQKIWFHSNKSPVSTLILSFESENVLLKYQASWIYVKHCDDAGLQNTPGNWSEIILNWRVSKRLEAEKCGILQTHW